MTDTEFVPITEVEVEMTAGELRAALAAHQRAEIELLTAALEASEEDVATARKAYCAAQAEVDRLRNALKMIAGDNWSSFRVDSEGAHVADQIVTEMRRIASEALSAPAKEAGHAE